MHKKLLNIQIHEAFGDSKLDEATKKFIDLVECTYENVLQDKVIIESLNDYMINDLHHNNQELKDLNDSLDNFNYQVSHDLRTSFMNTIGLTTMLEKYLQKGDEKKIKEILGYLHDNSNQAVRGIEQFLQVSKINKYLLSESKEWCHLPGMIQAVADNNHDYKEGTLTINHKEFQSIFYHEASLRSVFQNIIGNSIKYKSPDRALQIIVNLDMVDSNPVIIIEDNGLGMDLKNDLDGPFQLFKRLSNSKGIEGSGVGLHLVKKIIELNNGHVSLLSKVGEGTSIKIIFNTDETR